MGSSKIQNTYPETGDMPVNDSDDEQRSFDNASGGEKDEKSSNSNFLL